MKITTISSEGDFPGRGNSKYAEKIGAQAIASMELPELVCITVGRKYMKLSI